MVTVHPGARVFDLGPVRDSMMESTGHAEPTPGALPRGGIMRTRDGTILVWRIGEHAYLPSDVSMTGQCDTLLEGTDDPILPWVSM